MGPTKPPVQPPAGRAAQLSHPASATAHATQAHLRPRSIQLGSAGLASGSASPQLSGAGLQRRLNCGGTSSRRQQLPRRSGTAAVAARRRCRCSSDGRSASFEWRGHHELCTSALRAGKLPSQAKSADSLEREARHTNWRPAFGLSAIGHQTASVARMKAAAGGRSIWRALPKLRLGLSVL